FAASATVFAQARCQAPWTLPSHMSLFTSRLPSHCRVEDIGQCLPADIPTLAEQLAGAGYVTAAVVNDAQMKAHWGFSRGFAHWREFAADTPAGACDNLTREAVSWLAAAPQKSPFFLFLHYYDAHDPYEAPEAFRRQFGVTLSGEQTRQLLWHNRFPGTDLKNPELLARLIAAYDAELAWLDSEVGKLLAAVPPNTLVVIFSDHGEAFDEHGWMTHGASLYDEEIRVLLVMRPPEARPAQIATPVMLLDVAPTILQQCGLQPPAAWEGRDLSPALAGCELAARPQYAETTRVLEGLVLRGVVMPPLKAVHALPTGETTVLSLPAESATAPATAPPALAAALRAFVDESDYWAVYVAGGDGRTRVAVVTASRLAVAVPFGLEPETDELVLAETGTGVVVECGAAPTLKGLYWQTAAPHDAITLTATRGGVPLPVQVQDASGAWRAVADSPFRAEASTRFAALPEGPFRPPTAGVFVVRHPGRRAVPVATPAALDPATLRQLRSLGYVR
ncbi:MAG: sulfatase, partial [Microthrixaceae bacterium]|nr:sulfatase [Microthrixaceae bacterium]